MPVTSVYPLQLQNALIVGTAEKRCSAEWLALRAAEGGQPAPLAARLAASSDAPAP